MGAFVEDSMGKGGCKFGWTEVLPSVSVLDEIVPKKWTSQLPAIFCMKDALAHARLICDRSYY